MTIFTGNYWLYRYTLMNKVVGQTDVGTCYFTQAVISICP